MSEEKRKLPDGAHQVGYGRPPLHSRFPKGRSGNPGGRPRGMTAGRAHSLIMKEAFRPLTVREGEEVTTLPALQAVLRSLVARAARGNGPAQRMLIQMVQQLEAAMNDPSVDRSRPIVIKISPEDAVVL